MGPAIISAGDDASDTLMTPGGSVMVLAVRPSADVTSPLTFAGAQEDGTMYPLRVTTDTGSAAIEVDVATNEWTFLSAEASAAVSACPWIEVRIPANAAANTQVHFLTTRAPA